jgi:TetR/AcrR family transcriptional repressor of mexJK operon
VLHAAGDLFLAQGLQQVSMDAVAERAGVSKQTVYSHFRGKDELFKAVIAAKVGSYGFEEPDLPVAADLTTTLQTLGIRVLELIYDPDVIAIKRVVIAEAAAQPALAALFFESGPGATVGAVRALLERAVATGGLHVADIGHAAWVFLGMVTAPYQMPLLYGTAPPYDGKAIAAHVERVVGEFLRLYALASD